MKYSLSLLMVGVLGMNLCILYPESQDIMIDPVEFVAFRSVFSDDLSEIPEYVSPIPLPVVIVETYQRILPAMLDYLLKLKLHDVF